MWGYFEENMKQKNNDLDRWRSSVRTPFEGVFQNLKNVRVIGGMPRFNFSSSWTLSFIMLSGL